MTSQPARGPQTTDEPSPVVDAGAEFDRQLRTLVDLGYPTLARMSVQAFVDRVRPLRQHMVARQPGMASPTHGRVTFVIVVTKRLAPAECTMPMTSHGTKQGFVSGDTADVHRFEPIEAVHLPKDDVYVALDLERGDQYRNWSADEALVAIVERARTPITVDEGIALLTHVPAVLERNHCFMLVASRCGDRRVPALWISKGAPKLGWCWAGNRHTWLGHASCGGRVGASTG